MVKETAANAGGSTIANSAGTATVAGAVPVVSSPPEVQGPAQQEQQLSATTGTWSNEPGGYAYQWLQCNAAGSACTAISGASAAGYTPTAAVVGAHDPGAGERGQRDRRRGPGHLRGERPGAAGGARRQRQPHDHRLRRRRPVAARARQPPGRTTRRPASSPGCAAKAAPAAAIEGAVSQTYTPTAADLGYTIAVRETASNAGGWSAAGSEQTPAVVARVRARCSAG